MYIETKRITAYNASQVAYPVGPNKDSYNINSFFYQNLDTLNVTVVCELVRNDLYTPKVHKNNKKFREVLYIGTYKECVDFLMNNIMNTQKEWIYDDNHNYIYPN